MNNLIEKIENLTSHNIISRHSYFQLKYFLIGKEPTNQAKMWQCLKELQARKDNLEGLSLQIEEEKDKIELQEINLLKLNKTKNKEDIDDLLKRELEIKERKINRLTLSIKNTIKTLEEKKKFIEEECEFFIQTFKNIEKIEPLKHFDDLDSQKDYWGTKLLEKINLKILLENHIDTELVETVLSLPDDIPIKQQVLNKLNNLQSNILNLQNNFKKIEENNGKN
jgi:hypothetical protein